MRQPPPLGSRTWKPEEEDYLMEKWGQISVPAIAKKLNRTTNAVKVRAQRLGLGAVLMAGEYVTLNQLLLAVNGGSSSYGYKMKSWVENRGLPVHTKKVNRCSFRVVYIEEFWGWAERYRSFIDFSKMEPLALGEEPDWVAEQRKKDFEAYAIQRKDPWGEDEDSRLKMLLSKHRYSWAEISEMMHRSHGAIARRCRDLGIKDRPVSMELTGKRGTWTSEDFEILADGIRHGDSYAAIGKAVGRSEKCVRSKVYNDYLTENADKVREMLGDGSWGHGAPEMDVRHGFYISRARHQVRQRIGSSISHRIRCKDRTGNLLFKPRLRCQRVEKIIRRQYIVLRCPVPAGEVLEIAQRACHHQQLAHGQHTALDRTGHKLADALHPAKPGRAVLDKQCIDRIRLLQRIAHFVRVALRLDYKQICPCFLTYTAFGGAGNDLIQFQCF